MELGLLELEEFPGLLYSVELLQLLYCYCHDFGPEEKDENSAKEDVGSSVG